MHGINPALAALLQVILIDVVLAGDNAVVIGMVASRVPRNQRRKVVWWGMSAAVVLRIALALLTASILDVLGLMFAGGLLLLWVAWRLFRDIRSHEDQLDAEEDPSAKPFAGRRAMRQAIGRIVIADVSMSLDNVLAVAGAAMDHLWVLVIGLVLSIALMGAAASLIARLLHRYPWISYAGLMIILFVACRMMWDGAWEIFGAVT